MHTSCSRKEGKISSIYHLWGKYHNTSLGISFLSISGSKMRLNQNIVNYKVQTYIFDRAQTLMYFLSSSKLILR